jgi:DNA polymerase-1
MNLFEAPKEGPSVDLQEIRRKLEQATVIACDLETTGFEVHGKDTDRITIVALACQLPSGDIEGWAIETKDYSCDTIYKELYHIFHDKSKILVFHNMNFDMKFLNKNSIYSSNKLADTMIMAWLYDEDRVRHRGYGLKHCVLKHLNYKMSSYEEARSLFGGFEDYAADDAVQTLKLYLFFKAELEKVGLMDWFWKVEMPIAKVLIETEIRGVCLDKDQLKKLKKEAWQQLEKIEKEIHETVGYKFAISSPKQWAKVLFDEKQIGMRSDGTNEFSHRGKSGDWSTSNAVLEAIKRSSVNCKLENHTKCGHRLAKSLLKFREINTRQNVFIKPLLERCRVSPIIHPKFIQVGTVSGRFASKDPNYQNLPRKGGVRKAFIARPGCKIVKADYSQAELRLMAHMSGDPIMIDIYRSGGDIHQTTADACGVSRQAAKAINFGLIYRMSANRLQGQLALQGIEISIEEAYKYVKRYFRNYKKVRQYHKKVEQVVMRRLDANGEYGYVRTLGGRYRRLDRNYLTGRETAYTAITQAINTTIQGGVSDLIKIGMRDAQNVFRKNGWLDPERNIWKACIQGQVHDEIFVECEESIAEDVAEIITQTMVAAGKLYKIRVPMNADAEIVDTLAKG